MLSLVGLIDIILSIIYWVVIASVVASWLIAFGVVNTRNRAVYMIVDSLNRMTEPLYRPIRRLLPQMGGLDLSPMVVLLGIWFIRSLMREYLYPMILGV
jgi:YggT family protein